MTAAPRPSLLGRLRRCERGSSLVEFAMLLPILLLLFAVVVEGGRVAWSYQTAISGVRDATRYLGRVASSDVCSTGGLPNLNSQLLRIARDKLTYDSSGDATRDRGGRSDRNRNGLVPPAVTVNSVTTSLNCSFTGFRVSPAPVATVTAQITIEFPFGSFFQMFGAELSTVTTTISDKTRVFGA